MLAFEGLKVGEQRCLQNGVPEFARIQMERDRRGLSHWGSLDGCVSFG